MLKINLIVWTLQLMLIWLISGCENLDEKRVIGNEQLVIVYELPEELEESSGLILYNSHIYSINDSGNEPILYALSESSSNIEFRVKLTNASNFDWEDIAQDETDFFIADFGNNGGSRKNLSIYKLAKDSINREPEQETEAEKITFKYEDQIDFTPSQYSTQFDCESMFVKGDSIFLLTKNWEDEISVLYWLPKAPGDYTAKKILEFDCDGLLTGADYDPQTQSLIVCGSKQFVPYLLYFERISLTELHKAKPIRVDFFAEFGVQVEGIAFAEDDIYLSCESSGRNATLFKLSK